jgi:hypothetical protein
VSSRRYAKSYLKGVTGRLQSREDLSTKQDGISRARIRLRGLVQTGEPVQERKSIKQGMTEEDRY